MEFISNKLTEAIEMLSFKQEGNHEKAIYVQRLCRVKRPLGIPILRGFY